MRVDTKGFYLYWIDQNNELDMLDIATIRDVRTGPYAKKPRVSIFHIPPSRFPANWLRIVIHRTFGSLMVEMAKSLRNKFVCRTFRYYIEILLILAFSARVTFDG